MKKQKSGSKIEVKDWQIKHRCKERNQMAAAIPDQHSEASSVLWRWHQFRQTVREHG